MTVLSPEHIVFYTGNFDVPASMEIQGRFLLDGRVLPIEFYGSNTVELRSRMTAWIRDERERLARLDATREYLRSPEAIAERTRKAAETRAARKARSTK